MSEKSEQPEAESPSVRGVYGISVAAELSGFGVAALRLYEDYGLITPRPHRRGHPPLQRLRPRPAQTHRRTHRRRRQPRGHRPGPRP